MARTRGRRASGPAAGERYINCVKPMLAACCVAISLLGAGCAGTAGRVEPSMHTGVGSRSLGPKAVAERASPSVAVVETDVGVGLAFVIDPSGYLLTNRHVIEDADHIQEISFPAMKPPRSFSGAHVVYADPERDLAILQVPTVAPLPALRVARDSGPRAPAVSDPVQVLRRDAGEGERPDRLVAAGGEIESRTVRNALAGPGRFLGLSAPVQEGQSGGPVLDRFGRVVGVVTWTWRNVDGGYAIPIGDVNDMLAQRPDVTDGPSRTRRALERVHGFLGALGDGRYQTARRMTSPSWARQVRESTMSEILRQAMDTDREALHAFVRALDYISTDEEIESHERRMEILDEVIARTGSEDFRRALGLEGRVEPGLVVSFFYEFAHGYLLARRFGGKSSAESVEAGLVALVSIDAARTFAMAELSRSLSGRTFSVADLAVHPSEYRPTATVKLVASPGDGRPPETWLMVLRLEWGDWYVADVRAAAT